MNTNSNKIKNIQKRKMSIDRTVNVHVSYVRHRENCACACVLCTDEGLMSYLQMYSTGVCYVSFRWDMAWGKNCSCVWLFWCSVLCSSSKRE